MIFFSQLAAPCMIVNLDLFSLLVSSHDWVDCVAPPPRGRGVLGFHVDGGGGAAGGRKPDPVANRSVRKKYTLSQYTLLNNVHMHTLSQYCTVAGAQIASLS